MRLIQASTLKLPEFLGQDIPPYAIFSHTWGEDEASYHQFYDPNTHGLARFDKIKQCCALARKDGLDYVWVDTCCIDKSSSAELTEAINSMYHWYQSSQLCYVFLSDMNKRESIHVDIMTLKDCRWFQRGWTLQELLAPSTVRFFDRDWEDIGNKETMWSFLSRITGIHPEHLWYAQKASIAQKMSWAAGRQTTRIKDTAYCLLGLFGVNMPLLYGEGDKAFTRLQHEILKSSHDESIFA